MKQRVHAYCQNIKNALRGLRSREGAVVLVVGLLLVVLAAGTVAFTLEMIQVFKQYGMIPDTLVQCFFVAVTGEAGFMGWIKTSKERRRDRKWQKEDERQAREDMERQSQGSGNA